MIHGFVGRRRVGKTTLSDYLCGECRYQLRFSPRVTLPERENGITIVNAPTVRQLDEWFADNKTVTVIPELDVDETFLATAHSMRAWYSRMERIAPLKEEVGFIVDEARFKAVRESRDLDWLFRCTKPEIMHVYLTVHRPKDLNPDIRAILDYWYIFHVTQQIDLDILEDECNELIAQRAFQLQAREFYKFDVGEQKAYHWPPSMAHIWKPRAAPPENRLLNPVVQNDTEEDSEDFELM